MKDNNLTQLIAEASNAIGKTWPLYAFVTSNPLAGYENSHFKKAVDEATDMIGGKLYPDTNVYEEAWRKGEIDEETLAALLRKKAFQQHHRKVFLKCVNSIQTTAKYGSGTQ